MTLARIFGGVFGNDVNSVKKLKYEIEHEHLYAVYSSAGAGAKRWMHTFKLLSSLCLSAVLLSIILRLHIPENSGQCESFSSSASVKSTLSFDLDRYQCRWNNVDNVCSYDYTTKRFGYKGFLSVLMIVVAMMGASGLVIDAIFETVLRAPAPFLTLRILSQEIERDTLRLQYHKKVQAQLSRLNKGIIDYREMLLAKSQLEELEEFDAQWGVHLSKDGSEELVWMDKIALDLYDVVKRSHEIRVMLRKRAKSSAEPI